MNKPLPSAIDRALSIFDDFQNCNVEERAASLVIATLGAAKLIRGGCEVELFDVLDAIRDRGMAVPGLWNINLEQRVGYHLAQAGESTQDTGEKQ